MGFHHGLSGLNASSKSLDVIGHNIANSNTVGFKASRAEFNEMVASAMGAASGNNSGIGVSVAAVAQQFTQGVITPSANGLDMAINGDGFFVVQTPSGTAYTRNGAFQLNKVGELQTANQDKVMGYKIDPATGTRSSTLEPLMFPTGAAIPAKQTDSVSLIANLDARVDHTATPAPSRATTGTSLNVFDSQGVATPLGFYFEKVGANTWNIFNGLDSSTATPPIVAPSTGQVVADSTGKITGLIGLGAPLPTDPADLADENNYPTDFTYSYYGPDASTPPVYAIRQATFSDANAWVFTRDSSGNVISAKLSSSLASAANAATDPTDAAITPQSYTLNLEVNPNPSNPNSPPTVGGVPGPGSFNVSVNLDGLTQYGTSWSIAKLTQNGFTAGELTGVNVASDGTLLASYSNGVTRAEGQIALAKFTNTQGLQPDGNNNWVESFDSGPPVYGAAGSGSFGVIQGSALEESNVDLTAQLVGMMTAQRAYQANAQTIKTQDQIFSTLVNLR